MDPDYLRERMREKKWAALITQLINLTEQGEIKWRAEYPSPNTIPSDERVTIVFITDHADQHLRIYEYEYKYWTDEDRFEWTNGMRLEFTDAAGTPLYSVSRIDKLPELLSAVKYQAAGIDQIFEKFGVG